MKWNQFLACAVHMRNSIRVDGPFLWITSSVFPLENRRGPEFIYEELEEKFSISLSWAQKNMFGGYYFVHSGLLTMFSTLQSIKF